MLAFVFTLIYQKRTRVKGVFIASVLGAIGIYYGALVISVQEERGKDLTQESIETEGRYLEFLIYFDERIENTSILTFTGSNPFSNRGEFGKNNNYRLNTVDRTLHSDYVTYLYGIGVLGLVLIAYFYATILLYLKKLNGRLSKLKLDKSYLFLAFTYVIALLISQGIDGLYIYWARGIPFTILGYLIAIIISDSSSKLNSSISE